MKIIFMGSPDFAAPTLQTLIDSEHEIVAVYSQPPRPAQRGQQLRKTPIHQLAEQYNIPTITTTTLRTPEIQAQFKAFNADAAVICAYGLLLPNEILNACQYGCINVHPSLLPRWRGAAPIQWPIISGDDKTGICIMQMDKGLDTGDILLQKNYDLNDKINAGQLHDMLASDSAQMILDILQLAQEKALQPMRQNDEGVTYAKKLDKNSGHIDFSKTTREIDCLIRGVTPWPSAYFMINQQKFKVIEAICEQKNHNHDIATTIDDKLSIACADGIIKPTIIQRPSKKPMKTTDLLRGYQVPNGVEIQ